MKKLLFSLCLLTVGSALGQSVYVIDFVKIKNAKNAEAMYFYENNWKLYRDAARKDGIIKNYKLLTLPSDSVITYDLMLITEYADFQQYKQSEKNFEPIMKKLRPSGPLLLNELKPADFRQVLVSKIANDLFIIPGENN